MLFMSCRHELAHHPNLPHFDDDDGDFNRDSLGYYKCRNPGCRLVFTTNATRVRYTCYQVEVFKIYLLHCYNDINCHIHIKRTLIDEQQSCLC